MNDLVIGLMACFGLVLGGAAAMILVHRRLLRAWRLEQEHAMAGRAWSIPRRRAGFIPLPKCWLAIRSSNTAFVQASLAIPHGAVAWSDAMARAGEDRLFASAPVAGWTMVVGAALPDPAHDVDRLYRFLCEASRRVGEVQYFSMDCVLGFHAWARLRDGHVMRAYAWAGRTEWNEGSVTPEERALGMKCGDYGDEPRLGFVGDATAEMSNAERVPVLARRWGLDLAAATDALLQSESVGLDGAGE